MVFAMAVCLAMLVGRASPVEPVSARRPFRLCSPVFKDGGLIPDRYSMTAKGKNVSPPLRWENPPDRTKCFAVIAEDLDAPLIGTLSHWVLYNIPADIRELRESIPAQEYFADGMIQGRNFFRRNAYMGPNPPFSTHRYRFVLYALDKMVAPDPNMTRGRLRKTIDAHIVGKAELIGLYSHN